MKRLFLILQIAIFSIALTSCSNDEESLSDPYISGWDGDFYLDNIEVRVDGKLVKTISRLRLESEFVDGWSEREGLATIIHSTYFSRLTMDGFPTKDETFTMKFMHDTMTFNGETYIGEERYKYEGVFGGNTLLRPESRYITINFTQK